jgi:hypothetical protein
VAVEVRGVGGVEPVEGARVASGEAVSQLAERVSVLAGRAGQRPLDQAGADLQVDGDVDAGVQLELHPVAPRAEVVEPADDLVLPAAELVGHEGRREPVVAERLHRVLPPPAAPVADAQRGGGAVVAVAEHVGEDGDRLLQRRLCWKCPAVDDRGDGLDDDAARTSARHGGRGCGRHRCEP